MNLQEALAAIRPLDQEAVARCKAHWDNIGKAAVQSGKAGDSDRPDGGDVSYQ